MTGLTRLILFVVCVAFAMYSVFGVLDAPQSGPRIVYVAVGVASVIGAIALGRHAMTELRR